MTTLFKDDSVEFASNEHGEHFLTVLCGGIALYECRVKLTPEELAFIRDFGGHYIQKIAADISHDPQKFKDRFVPLA
jgi:hypothetical protein